MQGFEFKIGDCVFMKQEIGQSVPPPKYTVLERITQECHGGTQFHYMLRAFQTNKDGIPIAGVFQVNAFEVTAYPSDEQMEQMAKKSIATQKRILELHAEAGLKRPWEF